MAALAGDLVEGVDLGFGEKEAAGGGGVLGEGGLDLAGDDGAGVAVSLGHRVANWLLAGLTLLAITLVGAGERANGRTESD